MGCIDSHVLLLSFVQCDQIKVRPKKNVKIKESYSVVAVGIVAGGMGEGGRGRGNSCHVTHDMNFCNFFNLLSFTILNKGLYI